MSTFGDLRSVRVEVAEVPLEDWASSWKSRFRPVYPVPTVAVCPPWERVDDPEGGFTLVIEPKTAFGTGHHETTRLALKMMHAVVKPGDTVSGRGHGLGNPESRRGRAWRCAGDGYRRRSDGRAECPGEYGPE